ncbi:hypothetical protein HanRHA438_Chr15g0734681 [Helianthus annuus]|uniref:Uncharacterized protein n=1 Tax=Helianthus annuus TaxID=4232 RepID=A0A9K3E4T6_HELAN|nr:hypothetical protein HanXRQr2_Chr15g0722201 [Helianthus annuus]KAJ0458514.1 hypothetical protein HanIR_Chr15g0785931 [Helianthus annuus]KAJ0833635.1 hypothetical protein HanPSC8_Chr15g0692671 [Helianthus annuus]KAJ0847306.1 hypothetical protein HanRHA438_Chr15g0734681 [Helianthus annuus]
MACETSQRRGVAMVLAMVAAVVLSPLYVNKETHLETNSGFVMPMLLLGLIVAIKSTSSLSSSSSSSWSECEYDSSSSSWMLGIGSSSWGLAGILGMLLFVLYWQNSFQHLFWR